MREAWRNEKDKEPSMTADAKVWNDCHAGTKGLTGDARLEQMKKYGRRLNAIAPVAVAEPRLWASVILSRVAEGEILPPYVHQCADRLINGNIIEVEI